MEYFLSYLNGLDEDSSPTDLAPCLNPPTTVSSPSFVNSTSSTFSSSTINASSPQNSKASVTPKSISPPPNNLSILPTVNAAPSISTPLTLIKSTPSYHMPSESIIYTNPKVESLAAPIQGPQTPIDISQGGFARKLQNHTTGQVDSFHINPAVFDLQFHAYQLTGITANPADPPFHYTPGKEVSYLPPQQHNFIRFPPLPPPVIISKGSKGSKPSPSSAIVETVLKSSNLNETAANSLQPMKKSDKRKRQKTHAFNDPTSDDYLGPWAPRLEEVDEQGEEITQKDSSDDDSELNSSGKDKLKNEGKQEKDEKKLEANDDSNLEMRVPEKLTTVFHGKSQNDYQGRSFIEPPPDLKESSIDPGTVDDNSEFSRRVNYIPKKGIYTYVGHTMGVQAIRFFPKYGHLLLSASLDSQIRLWDVYNQRRCLRSYLGHDQGVRDIQFTPDGRQFYSCGYDKKILLWDTEYGKIMATFSNGHIPYCVSLNTDETNICIVGSANKRAVQFDSKTGSIVQEYNEHLAAVNSVTFCENNRKIVTTSDDKKIFIWDYGIPVVVKHIAEPSMHSMPSVTVHPNKKYFAAQSMDNQIVVYEASGRFRYQGRKHFRGHISAGYSIHPGFSPDGQYIMSGDAGGRLWFWDWKTMKNYRTLQCHNGVCIDCAWHPLMTSRVATCGWDGLIKLWD